MFEKKKLKECTMESIKIALLGLGTVGTGVYKVLKAQKEEMVRKLGAQVEIKKILVYSQMTRICPKSSLQQCVLLMILTGISDGKR